MQQALAVARKAFEKNEVPIGAVLQTPTEVLQYANICHSQDNPLLHAEVRVLQAACERFPRSVLQASTLFVTLEPCPMCMGAILHSHVGRLVFGSYNLKWGAAGTVIDFSTLFPVDGLEVYGGILEQECATLLASFFQERR